MVRQLVNYNSFLDEFVKIAQTVAEEQAPRENVPLAVAGGAGALAGGGLLASPTTRGRIGGWKRMYHGTAAPTAEKIRQEGLKTSFGGTGTAAADLAIGRDIANVSKDNVYMTGKKSSGQEYAAKGDMMKYFKDKGYSLDDVLHGEVDPEVQMKGGLKYMKGQIPGMRSKGRIDIDLPYEKFQKAEADPLVKSLLKQQLPPFLQPSEKGFKEHAAILAEDVDPKYMKGGKGRVAELLRRGADIPEYAAKNPGRFGKGLAAGAAGLGLVGGGVHLMRKGLRRKQQEAAEQ